jgi:tetratricopeptide (TPR) repeat protein
MTGQSKDAVAIDLADLVSRGQFDEAMNRYPDHEPEIRMFQQLRHSPPELMRSILKASTEANTYHQDALRFSRNGNLREAEMAFDKAIQLMPEFAAAYTNRAILYARTGRRPKALADLRTAVRLTPRSERAKGMLAQAQAGEWERFKV